MNTDRQFWVTAAIGAGAVAGWIIPTFAMGPLSVPQQNFVTFCAFVATGVVGHVTGLAWKKPSSAGSEPIDVQKT